MTIIFTVTAACIVLTVLYYNYKATQDFKAEAERYKQRTESLAWNHDSNLKLLQKIVKTRVAALEKRNRELEKKHKVSETELREQEQKLKKEYENFITEVTRYKVWKFSVKTGMEASVYPDRMIIIADSKETAKQLVTEKYDLEDVALIYDIIQSQRKKNEILLESYDIL